MPVQFANPNGRTLQKKLAKDMVRLRNPQTGELLHQSGQGTTTDQKYGATFSKRYSIAQLRTFIEKQGDWVFETEGALCQASDGECT